MCKMQFAGNKQWNQLCSHPEYVAKTELPGEQLS